MSHRARVVLVTVAILAGCGDPERMTPFRSNAVDSGASEVVTSGDSGVIMSGSCRDDRDCDDRIDCTDDTCVVGGVCEHLAVMSRCPAGQRCFPSEGCATMATRRCMTDAQCDDGVPCTRDVCIAGGTCNSIRDDSRCAAGQVCGAMGCLAMGRCTGDGECGNGIYCDGVERCVSGVCQAGTRVSCSDNDPCTGDVCNEGMRRCENPPLNPCGGAVQAGTYRLTPAPTHSCAGSSIGPLGTITITTSSSGVEVSNAPITLRGPGSTDGSFVVEGEENRSGYRWQYVFTGSFVMPGRFTGVWNASVSGGVLANTCSMRSVTLEGVRQ